LLSCRSLLSVTFRAASAALCRAAASHHAGACEETGNANPYAPKVYFVPVMFIVNAPGCSF
jgi:hypothetical protein